MKSASSFRRKLTVVIATPPDTFDEYNRHTVGRLENEGWKVVLVEDPEILFDHMVNPRCFCVFISDRFRVNPNLIIERATEISNAAWVLVTEKNPKGIISKSTNSGASAVLPASSPPVKFLHTALHMLEKFKRESEKIKPAKTLPKSQPKSTRLPSISFNAQNVQAKSENSKPLVILALKDLSFIDETIQNLEAEGWAVKKVGYFEELKQSLKSPECFCVFISQIFCDRLFERIEQLQKNSTARWVLVTSNITSSLQKNKNKLGLNDFLIEPGQPVEYAMKAKALLKKP